tara:strand:- start:176 stop:1384 length:1209 start_codon:yes stop_codon:yes gene_type:complete
MKIALIADTFPPLRSSGAVQLRDLSREFIEQGHNITILVASPQLPAPFILEEFGGVQVLRLRTPKMKDVGYIRRTFAEFLMPFFMRQHYRNSSLLNSKWDAVVWYSPSIFLGPFVSYIKKTSHCPSYLIIRDIFPEWAVDMGLMGKGLPYIFFKAIANYQYSLADVIGVQTPGNSVYFKKWLTKGTGRLEVLQNWLADSRDSGCTIRLQDSMLSGRRIFVYAGNMGVAQGIGILFRLAVALRERSDIGFVFVGRGSYAQQLRDDVTAHKLENVLFYDEIDPDEIPGLYSQCDAGLVSLDPRHRSHNIPGKFLSYMQAGLPVLAAVNDGNDIVHIIQSESVGYVSTDGSSDSLKAGAEKLVLDIQQSVDFKSRCKQLGARLFAPATAVKQIVTAINDLGCRNV